MELQVMLSDAIGLVDFQQQHNQQQHLHHHPRNVEHPRFAGISEALFGRSTSPPPEDRRTIQRQEEEDEEEAVRSPLATLSPSASSGEEDPAYSSRECGVMFPWNGARRGVRANAGRKRSSDELVEGRSSSCGLQAVAAAAAAAMTSLAGRKRKLAIEDGEDLMAEGQRSALESPTARKERHQNAAENNEEHAIREVSQEVPQVTRTLTGSQHHQGSHSGWHVDDIDDNLAADLEGSLSGLGVDLTSSSSSYHMSESLLSLPALTVFKQEVLSPTSQSDTGCRNPPPSNAGGGTEEACGTAPKDNDKILNTRLQLASDHQQHRQNLQHILHYGLNNGRRNPSGGQLGSTLEDDGSIYKGGSHEEGRGVAPFEGIGGGKRLGVTNGGSETAGQGNFHLRFEKNSNTETNDAVEDSRFQYVLAAATSIATKVNEETLTYLNQGQSYEIKLKKLGDLLAYRGKIFKSVIRICFHERRLQYAEREQLAAWQQSRPGDRVLEVDVPLSYGACDIVQDPCALNAVEFLWDPTKEVGVYIKVNCISTEFTPKKHGGEKGVPFRIQVETYSQAPSGLATAPLPESQKKATTFVPGRRLHAAACQIKVFKLKGADRKHKQDREKILKRPALEQEKYQPSYDCTVLTDINSESVYMGSLLCGMTSSLTNGGSFSPTDNRLSIMPSPGLVKEEGSRSPEGRCVPLPPASTGGPPSATPIKAIPDQTGPHQQMALPVSVTAALPTPSSAVVAVSAQDDLSDVGIDDFCQVNANLPLNTDTTALMTTQWLRSNRFSSYLHAFASFSGADLLRLSRDDLIQICGLSDGIRLYNALHLKTIIPRLTLYMCFNQSLENDITSEGTDGCTWTTPSCPVYHALYLESTSCRELAVKVARLAGIPFSRVYDVFLKGPSGVNVILTDEVVQNLPEDSLYTVDVLRDHSGERYRLLLKANNQ